MSQFTTTVNLTRDANIRVAVSTSPTLSSPTYSSLVGTQNHRAKVTVTGLAAGTQYYYGVEINGLLTTSTVGSFRTPAAADTELLIALSGDASTGSNHAVFDAIRIAAPDLFLYVGDFHYEDIDTNQHYRHIGAIEHQFRQSAQHQLYRTIPTLYMYDDHDYGPNDSTGDSVTRDAAIRAYRRIVPAPALALAGATDPVYYSFERTLNGVGVVFIVTDQRSMSSLNSATDNSSKTMLGAAQKTWFKNIISDANNAEKLLVWVCSRVWGGVPDPSADHWGSYTTERTELVDHIKTHAKERFVVLSADMHALAIDDGTNTDFATGGGCPLPTFQASPLDRTGATTHGGATYSEGHFANNNQYGLMHIAKTGRKQLTVTWTGKRHTGTTLVTHTMEFNLGNVLKSVSTHGILQKAGVTRTTSVNALLGAPESFDPWDEIASTDQLASGTLVLSGLDLSQFSVVRLLLTGITVTSDDTQIRLRMHVGGSEVATGYLWVDWRCTTAATDSLSASTADTSVNLTIGASGGGVGSGSTASFGSVVTLTHPGSTSLHKTLSGRSVWRHATDATVSLVAGLLPETGAITGFTVLGTSNLTAGRVTLIGVE